MLIKCLAEDGLLTRFYLQVPSPCSEHPEPIKQRVEGFFREQYDDWFLSHNVVVNANPLWKLINARDDTGRWLCSFAVSAFCPFYDHRCHYL
jgi:hypothetical protein